MNVLFAYHADIVFFLRADQCQTCEVINTTIEESIDEQALASENVLNQGRERDEDMSGLFNKSKIERLILYVTHLFCETLIYLSFDEYLGPGYLFHNINSIFS